MPISFHLTNSVFTQINFCHRCFTSLDAKGNDKTSSSQSTYQIVEQFSLSNIMPKT